MPLFACSRAIFHCGAQHRAADFIFMPEPQLDYEQHAGFVSRKQYRRLMALTLLNTILLAGFVIGPTIGPMVRSQWRQFQERREQRRVEKQQAAAIAAAKAYVAPVGQVIYDEHPDSAAKLLAADPAHYRIIRQARTPYFAPRPWQPPVELTHLPVSPWNAANDMAPAAFLGTLSLPSGPKKLVVIYVQSSQRMQEEKQLLADHQLFRIETNRGLIARVISDLGARSPSTMLQIGRPGWFSSSATWTRNGENDWEHGKVDFDMSGLMRIYAGQVDPADPAHFTIAYDCDGQRGTIDGWLRTNDRIEMALREGTVVHKDPQGRASVWELPKSPATRAARASGIP